MKTCGKCKLHLPLSTFYRRSGSGYYSSDCRPCIRAAARARYRADPVRVGEIAARWQKKNPVLMRAVRAAWSNRNPDKVEAKNKRWVKSNPAAVRAAQKRWYKNRGHIKLALNRKRIRAEKIATPRWLSSEQLAEIDECYSTAAELSWLGDEPLTVDHIIPVLGRDVCGLHVPWNLQVIPLSQNVRKGNRVTL